MYFCQCSLKIAPACPMSRQAMKGIGRAEISGCSLTSNWMQGSTRLNSAFLLIYQWLNHNRIAGVSVCLFAEMWLNKICRKLCPYCAQIKFRMDNVVWIFKRFVPCWKLFVQLVFISSLQVFLLNVEPSVVEEISISIRKYLTILFLLWLRNRYSINSTECWCWSKNRNLRIAQCLLHFRVVLKISSFLTEYQDKIQVKRF